MVILVEEQLKQSSNVRIWSLWLFLQEEHLKDLTINEPNVEVLHISSAEEYKDKIDVMILCGGSATDLPDQGPYFARMFNTIDSFDTHAKIPEYFSAVDQVAKESGKISIISVGWDPGLFSSKSFNGRSDFTEWWNLHFLGKRT